MLEKINEGRRNFCKNIGTTVFSFVLPFGFIKNQLTSKQREEIRKRKKAWYERRLKSLKHICNVNTIAEADVDDDFFIRYATTAVYENINSQYVVGTLPATQSIYGRAKPIIEYHLTRAEKEQLITEVKNAKISFDYIRKNIRPGQSLDSRGLNIMGFDFGESKAAIDNFISQLKFEDDHMLNYYGTYERVVGVINQKGKFSSAFVGYLNGNPIECDLIEDIDGIGLAAKGGDYLVLVKKRF